MAAPIPQKQLNNFVKIDEFRSTPCNHHWPSETNPLPGGCKGPGQALVGSGAVAG